MPAPTVPALADPAIAAPDPARPIPPAAQPSPTAAPASLDVAMAAQVSRLEPASPTPSDAYLTQLLDLSLDTLATLARVPTADTAAVTRTVAMAAHSIRRYLDLCAPSFRDADRDRLIVITRYFVTAVSTSAADAETKAVAYRLGQLGLDVTGPIADAPTAHSGANERTALAAIGRAGQALEAARTAPGTGRDAELAAYHTAATTAAFGLRVAADAAGVMVGESPRHAIVALSPAAIALEHQLDEIDQFVRASRDDHAAYAMLFQHERRLLEALGREVPMRSVGLAADPAQLTAAMTDVATEGGAKGPPTSVDDAVDRVLAHLESYIEGTRAGMEIALAAISERVPAPEPSFLEAAILYVVDSGLNAVTDGMWSMIKDAGSRVMKRPGGSEVSGALMWLAGHAGKAHTPKKPATAALTGSAPALTPDAVRNDFAAGLRRELVDRALQIRLGFSEARGPLEQIDLAVLTELVEGIQRADLPGNAQKNMVFETISQWCRLKELVIHSDEHGALQTPEIFNNGLNIAGSLQIDLLVPADQPAAEPTIGRVALVGVEPGVVAFLKRQRRENKPIAAAELNLTKVFRLSHVLDFRESLVIVQRGADITINHMSPSDRALLAARVRSKSYPNWKSGGDDYASDKSLATVSDSELLAAAAALVHNVGDNAPLDATVGVDSFQLQ